MDLGFMQKLMAFFASLAAFFTGLFAHPTGVAEPKGQTLDLSGYRLVFSDEFNGDQPDLSAWFYRTEGLGAGIYCAPGQTTVADGVMTVTAQYREDGVYGAGWYTAALALERQYRYGYFEIRCTCAPGGGFWSAFWMQANGSYEHGISRGGVGGAEIDIMEAPYYNEKTEEKRNSVVSAIHCNGGDDDPARIESTKVGRFRANDIYGSFNTYGLEWTENEYVFYVNGVEAARGSKGVSRAQERLIVSLEVPATVSQGKDFSTSMAVDYVRIWQK